MQTRWSRLALSMNYSELELLFCQLQRCHKLLTASRKPTYGILIDSESLNGSVLLSAKFRGNGIGMASHCFC